MSGTTWLPLIGVAGQAALFLISLILARALPEGDFHAYVLAASLFALLSGVAPLGVDQLVLKVLPILAASGDTGRRVAFRRFVIGRALLGTAVAALAGLLWAAVIDPGPGGRAAILLALLGLPLAVTAGIAAKVMVAEGRPARGLAATQAVLPAMMLAIFAGLAAGEALPGGAGVVGLWGLGWAVALAVVSPGLREFLAPRGPAPDRVAGEETWARAALPLFGRRAAAALGAQAGILAVGGLASDPADVAVLAIASVASALVLIPATMTHPVFARDLAPLVGRRDALGIRMLLRRRALRIAPATGLAVAAMLLVPGQVMSLFGQAPDANSAWVLRLLVLSAGITAALGILPVLHIYAGRGRVVTLCLAAGLLAQLTGLLLLVPILGAIGAAASQLVGTMVGLLPLFIRLRWMSEGWSDHAV